MSSVKVFLDNYHGACYPGQTIAGRVECNFDEMKNLRAVRVKFRGRAETEWTETERYYDHSQKKHRSRSVRYSAEESYIDAEYNLVQGGDNFQLSAGRHTYPFSYIMPAQLPSSYEGSYGNIRYYVKATVDRPWKFDYEDKFSLNVVSPIDLNYLPGLRDPVNTSVDKTMCSCWCNDTGSLTFNMSIPATGYVPGQEVNIGAYVQNMTNVTAENVKFKIVGDIEFITHHPSTRRRYDESVVTSCTEGGIGAHGEKSWTSSLTIPSEQFPNLIPCSIINIDYTLKAKVVVPCPHTNLENEVPVMIGTVPLSGVSTTFPAGPPPGMPTVPDMSFPSGDAAPPYPAGGSMPYPSGGSAPYPPGGSAPYPPNGSAPYPPGGSAPYPPGGSAPYPSGGSAPYPPGGSAPYPPGGSAPYPPGGSAPYPPGGSAPYPPGGSAPYPPGGSAKYSESQASYPPGGTNGYMDSKSPSAPPTGAPYPPASASAPSAPATDSGFELPSYDEAKEQIKEKSRKPE